MSDETVRVPAADILALADKWEKHSEKSQRVPRTPEWVTELRALVDAAERPDEWDGFTGHILTTHADSEEYARIHNEGYEAAILHEIAPDPTFADDWFAEQLRVAKFEAWWEGARANSLSLNPYDAPAPAAPVSEPLCECGHDKDKWHGPNGVDQPMACHHHTGRAFCPCTAFTPAPLSSPRRTRDEGTEDEAGRFPRCPRCPRCPP